MLKKCKTYSLHKFENRKNFIKFITVTNKLKNKKYLIVIKKSISNYRIFSFTPAVFKTSWGIFI